MHRVSITMEADFCIATVEEAIAKYDRPETRSRVAQECSHIGGLASLRGEHDGAGWVCYPFAPFDADEGREISGWSRTDGGRFGGKSKTCSCENRAVMRKT